MADPQKANDKCFNEIISDNKNKKMKKAQIAGIVLIAVMVVVIYAMLDYNRVIKPIIVKAPVVLNQGSYTGSDYKGNYVYGAAMNLAWNELNESIIQEKIKLNTNDKAALEITKKLNNAVFTKNDLDEKSYYVKSGFGQKTVDVINRESKEKFPSKSFADLNVNLRDIDIISYAYFLKEVEYETQFKEKDVLFNGETVKGFYAEKRTQKENVIVLYYENDDKFIIKLRLKDNNDELILAKGFDINDPDNIINVINEKNKYINSIEESDIFEAPNLHLDYHRDYEEMIGKFLANSGFQDYYIAQMFENIKFDMDYKGARVENEAAIIPKWGAKSGPVEIRKFILNKPYWVVMKRSDSRNPYFVLGVNNTELMKK